MAEGEDEGLSPEKAAQRYRVEIIMECPTKAAIDDLIGKLQPYMQNESDLQLTVRKRVITEDP